MRDLSSLMLVGRVVGAHGIRGELTVVPLTSDPGRFYDLEHVLVSRKDPSAGEPESREIEGVRIHKGRVLLKLADVVTRNDAEALIGREVYVDAAQQLKLEEGEFYIDSLVGLTAVDENGATVGRVVSVDDIPGNPIVTIELPRGKELLVPFSKQFVKTVDLAGTRLVLLEAFRGLLDPVVVC